MGSESNVLHNVSGWLRVYDDGRVDRTWTGPSEAKFMTDPVPPHEELIEGVATHDITIDASSGLRVRLYMPECKAFNVGSFPIILHFHGGGFCISQPDWFMYYNFYTKLAKLAQAVVVSVYQRLAPEHQLPAAIDDGYSSLLWLKSLAKGNSGSNETSWLTKHCDFNRVFLIGDSSGGNIVHEVASRASHASLDPLKLAGGVIVHPGFQYEERSKSEVENPESPFLTLDMVDTFLSLALPVGSTKDHPITCPMGRAAPAMEGLNMPPVLLCLAEKDLFWDTQMEYYEAMKKCGKKVELLISNGMGHSFYLNKIALDMDPNAAQQNDQLLQGIVEFVKNM